MDLKRTQLATGADVRKLDDKSPVSLAFRGDRAKEGEMVRDPVGGGGRAGSKAAKCRALGHHQPRCRIDEDVLIVDSNRREGAAVVRQPPLETIAPARPR